MVMIDHHIAIGIELKTFGCASFSSMYMTVPLATVNIAMTSSTAPTVVASLRNTAQIMANASECRVSLSIRNRRSKRRTRRS